MKLRNVLAASVLAVAGCATAEYVWVKPTAADGEFAVDRGQCLSQAYSATAANPYSIAGPMSQAAAQLNNQRAIIFATCMQGKGWRRELERP